jgi:hypothetical protein
MNSHRSHLIAGSLLLIVVVVACSLSPASSSPNSTATNPPAGQAPATNAPATNPPATNLPASGGCTNAYFPTSSGSTWSYSSRGSVLGPYTYTSTVADVSDTGFTVNVLTSLAGGTSSSVKWNCQDGNLAALDSGADSLSVSGSNYKITSTSITADGYNVPNTFAAGKTWSEKVTVIGKVQSGTRTLDSQIAAMLNCSAAGAESITVAAGTFDTVKSTCTETIGVSAIVNATPIPAGVPSNLDITNWYSKGVGLVKSIRVNNTAGGTTTVELTQYKVQ